MRIVVIGDDVRYNEFREKFAESTGLEIERSDGQEEDLKTYDAIFDLNFDDDSENLDTYAGLKNKPVFVSAVKQQLAEHLYMMQEEKIKCNLVGLNCLPTFINRPKWEISSLHHYYRKDIETFLSKLNCEFHWVNDRVGMVTPRVVLMIINEACYTVQEGTATIEDIDLGMKLGTNYPMGPFEWADKIGISDVFEGLASLYEDTKEERYKICPLLKTKYLKNETFYKNQE